MSRKSFKLFFDSLDVLDELSDEQSGQLFKAIRDYEKSEADELSGLMKAIFTPFKNNADRAKVAYKEACERNKANGKKGGRPMETEANPLKPEITHSVISEPTPTHSNPKKGDKDKDKDKDKMLSPFDILQAYRIYVIDDIEKINESWSYKELRKNIHDLEEVMIGLKNYGIAKKGIAKNIQKLDSFLSNKIYKKFKISEINKNLHTTSDGTVINLERFA